MEQQKHELSLTFDFKVKTSTAAFQEWLVGLTWANGMFIDELFALYIILTSDATHFGIALFQECMGPIPFYLEI